MERVLRAAFYPNTQQPVPMWSQGTVPAATGKPANTGTSVNGATNQRKRKRTLYSKWQQMELENVFEVVPYPDISTREQLANVIKIPECKVQVWFQNRRARKNKSGKFLYRRGSPLHTHHFCCGSAYPSQRGRQRNAVIPTSLPPNQPMFYGPSNQYASSMPQAGYQPFQQMSPPASEQYSAVPYVHDYSQSVNSSPEYGSAATMYDNQMVDLEPITIPSQGSYWDRFPQAMNENGPQTSLGYISDVIYNAAILTNLSDV
ncbi:homeobox protein SEBOX [Leptodactylus fuscus]|uniref:homeobox protein SEBOX n=1 Tax=Leptodactylus fuscus TaxID=238119 RepID=UPI003F4F218E